MNVAIIGASGYVGAELIGLLLKHDKVSIQHLVVSENSASSMLAFSELHARWQGICDLPLHPFSQNWFEASITDLDAVFLATPHEFSAQWAPFFIEKGVTVFDLSGAFRINEPGLYNKFYGFEHPSPGFLNEATYGLVEWLQPEQLTNLSSTTQPQLISLPGCYPTATLLAIKPLINNHLLEPGLVVANGISGVSGAGRNESLANQFNEVSLKPYNILKHRHQPEISQEAGRAVVFNPHIAPFKRGLLSTVTMTALPGVTKLQIDDAIKQAYSTQPLIRIKYNWPKIDDVAYTPFADVYWEFDETSQVVVVAVAIDNLLKGAASQAVQCLNITLGLASDYALIPELKRGEAA